MAIIEHNRFSADLLVLRTARLEALKTYIETWGATLHISAEMIAWALGAYDVWVTLLGLSSVENGESKEAYQTMHEADDKTFDYCIKCRDLLREKYGYDDQKLAVYGIEGKFPQGRRQKMNSVRDLLDGHRRMVEEGDPNVLPEDFITKLQGFYDAGNSAYNSILLKEKPEADKSFDNQNKQFEEDSRKLSELYKTALMTWDDMEPYLVQLGFAPRIPKPGGGQPGIPDGLSSTYVSPKLSITWNACENTTSYQLVYSEDLEVWEELYAGADTQFDYDPPAVKRTYKVRARNANGFSDWSNTIEFEPPDVPE